MFLTHIAKYITFLHVKLTRDLFRLYADIRDTCFTTPSLPHSYQSEIYRI